MLNWQAVTQRVHTSKVAKRIIETDKVLVPTHHRVTMIPKIMMLLLSSSLWSMDDNPDVWITPSFLYLHRFHGSH